MVKRLAYNAGDLSSIPGLGRYSGNGNGNPLQYSCLKNPMDGGAWWATVHGVTENPTRLSDFTFSFILYWCFSFWLTSLCIIGSSFIHLIRIDSCVLFNSWVIIFHCVYVPQLSYPFVWWWTSRLLPCSGYYKQCCDNIGGHMSLSVLVSSVCMPSSGIAGS